MDEKLKPCPFCGGVAQRVDIPADEHDPNAGGSYIACQFCLASSSIAFGDKSSLVDNWNSRAGDAALADEVEKLRAERDEWQTRAEQYETAWVNENAANCELTEEIAKLRAEREELQRRVDGFRDEFLEKALEWRGISFVDEACDKCGGSGVVAYGSTATWHGGIGGQAITNGVCDKCWGSGSRLHKWADLRKLRAALAEKGE